MRCTLKRARGIRHHLGVVLQTRAQIAANAYVKPRQQRGHQISPTGDLGFLRRSRFDPSWVDSSTSVIVRLADLESGGKQIDIPLVNQFSGDGVGAGTLRGNGLPIWADWRRALSFGDRNRFLSALRWVERCRRL